MLEPCYYLGYELEREDTYVSNIHAKKVSGKGHL